MGFVFVQNENILKFDTKQRGHLFRSLIFKQGKGKRGRKRQFFKHPAKRIVSNFIKAKEKWNSLKADENSRTFLKHIITRKRILLRRSEGY
jgi:hypothetical protein